MAALSQKNPMATGTVIITPEIATDYRINLKETVTLKGVRTDLLKPNAQLSEKAIEVLRKIAETLQAFQDAQAAIDKYDCLTEDDLDPETATTPEQDEADRLKSIRLEKIYDETWEACKQLCIQKGILPSTFRHDM